MDRASVSDLNSLDRDALLALFIAQQEKLDSLIADRDAEVRRLEAELVSHRQTLSEQADELRSRSERITSKAHGRQAAACDLRYQEREDRHQAGADGTGA